MARVGLAVAFVLALFAIPSHGYKVLKSKQQLSTPVSCDEDGQFPNPDDCGSYVRCADGAFSILPCIGEQHFNPETKRCEEPCAARCDRNIACECGWDSCQSTEAASDMTTIESTEEVSEQAEGSLRQMLPTCLWDGPIPHFDCTRYLICTLGEVLEKRCPSGQHFSIQLKSCVGKCDAYCDPALACECGWDSCQSSKAASDMTTITRTEEVSEQAGGSLRQIWPACNWNVPLPHFDCRRYWICIGGVVIEKSCPANQHFSKVRQRCVNKCDAHCAPALACECDWDSCLSSKTDSDMTTIAPTEEVPEEAERSLRPMSCHLDGLSPYYSDCTRYFTCTRGKAYVMRCPSGLHFSMQLERCVSKCEAHCDRALAQECNWNTQSSPSHQQNLQYPYFTCMRDGLHRYPRNCRLFIQCSNGEAYVQQCPGTLHFSEKTQRCEAPCDARCDPLFAEECGWDDTPLLGDDVCERPRYKGPCHQYRVRHYYDSSSGQCKKFVFGGCESNGNNFETKAECLRTCAKKQPTEYPITTPRPSLDGFTCPEDGLYSDPGHCTTYIRCSADQLFVETCPGDFHFSHETRTCEHPCKAHCDETLADLCGWDGVAYTSKVSTEDSWKYTSNREYQETTEDSWLDSSNNIPTEEPWTDMNSQDITGDSFKLSTEHSARYNPQIYRKHSPNKNSFQPNENFRKYFDTKSIRKYPNNVWKSSWDETTDFPPESTEDSSRYSTDDALVHTTEDPWMSTTLSSNELWKMMDFSCSDDGLYSNPEDCRTYIHCSNGNPHLMTCPENMHFNQELQQCQPPCDAHCSLNVALDCGWLEYSKNEEVDCESGPDQGPCDALRQRYFYDRERGKCRRFMYGGCRGNGNNFRTLAECQDKCQKKVLAGFRCPSYNGNFGHFPDCVSYYECKRGIPTLKRCPRGTAFHHLKAKCVPEHQAVCVYQCRHPDAVYPLEGDCRKYIDCVNGVPKVERCPPQHSFDREAGDCVAGIARSCQWS